jgi:hypothetical protein
MRRRLDLAALLAAVAFGVAATSNVARAQDTVRIAVPSLASFDVTNVLASAVASPNPTRVSFDNAVIPPTQIIRISVRADGDLAGPESSSIPASNVSWTTSNVTNGIGVNGVLSKTSYTVAFEGQPMATTGGVDIAWTLSAPGAAVRAGTHQATLRWKIEASTP